MRPSRLLSSLLAVAALTAACSGGDTAPSGPSPEPSAASPSASPSATADATPSPTPVETVTAPLTGAPTTDLAAPERPVLAVKVENTAAARPQAGLDEADVVYEELVEGGVTRFVALFNSHVPEVVGPVRSARLVDTEVLPAYHPILAYSGAREEVTAALRRSGITLLVDDGGDAFYREQGRPGSHDLMGRGGRLYEKGAARGADEPAEGGLVFSADAPTGAVSCDGTADCGRSIDVRMSGANVAGWTYDDAEGGYRRDQNGTPSVMADGAPVIAANVVALAMDVGTGGCCDSAGSSFVVTDVTGEGHAIVLRDGHRYAVTWRKPSVAEHLELLGPDGEPFPLAPGPTWMHLAPSRYVPR